MRLFGKSAGWMRIVFFVLTLVIGGCSSVEVVSPNKIVRPSSEKYFIAKIQWERGKDMKVGAGKKVFRGSGQRVGDDEVEFGTSKVRDLLLTIRGVVDADLKKSSLMTPVDLKQSPAALVIEPFRGFYDLDEETADLTLIASIQVGGKSIWLEAIRVSSKKDGQIKAAQAFEAKLIDELKSAGLF